MNESFTYLFRLDKGSSVARVLLFLAIPGHFTFILLIIRLATNPVRISFLFIFLYLMAALIQVSRKINNKINEKKFNKRFFSSGSNSSLHCSMDSRICLAT